MWHDNCNDKTVMRCVAEASAIQNNAMQIRKRQEETKLCGTYEAAHIHTHTYITNACQSASKLCNGRQPRECKYSLWHVVTPCSTASTNTHTHIHTNIRVSGFSPFLRSLVVIVIFEVTVAPTHTVTTSSTRADTAKVFAKQHIRLAMSKTAVLPHILWQPQHLENMCNGNFVLRNSCAVIFAVWHPFSSCVCVRFMIFAVVVTVFWLLTVKVVCYRVICRFHMWSLDMLTTSCLPSAAVVVVFVTPELKCYNFLSFRT